jgi:mannose/fructose/N-acetylgalactosamine-specific phosphotransferase system component IIB
MASNKNFVVKNGLQVAENLIFTSADLGNVGVGTTLPTTTLEVLGQGIKSQDALFTGIVTAQGQSNLTNLSVSGVSTLGTFQVSSGIATASSGIITYYGDASNVTGIATSVLGGTNINVNGVIGNVTVNLDDIIDITGANISGVGTIVTANVTNLTASGISTLGTVQISSDLNVSGISTFASDLDVNASIDVSTDLTVDGLTDLDELNVAGISTFASDVDVNASVDISSNLTVDGLSDLDELNVAGVSTFASNLDINASIDVDGLSDLDELNVAGIATFASDLDINSSVDISNNLNVSGVVTATLFSGNGSGLTGLPVGSIGIQSEGTIIGTAVTTLNFIGAGNTFKITGTIVDISIDSGGGGGVASTITVTDESTDTTCFPIFAIDATGDINPKTGSNLTFNSSTGALTVMQL